MSEHWESLTRIIRDFYDQNVYSETGQISSGGLNVVVNFLSQLTLKSLSNLLQTSKRESKADPPRSLHATSCRCSSYNRRPTDWLIDWLFLSLYRLHIILKNKEKEGEWQGSLNWKPGAYKRSNWVTSENKRTHTPPPPLHSKFGCLLFSKGSSKSDTILQGGDGAEKALFSPFEVGKTSEGRFSAKCLN